MHKSSKILAGAAVFLVVVFLYLFLSATTVFAQLSVAFVLAYLLNPMVDFLERRGVTRAYGIIVAFCLSFLVCGGFVFFIIFSISRELSSVQLNLPAYAQHIYEIMPVALKGYLGIETTEKLYLRLYELLHQFSSTAPDLVRPLLSFLQRALSSTVSVLLAMVGCLIIPVYIFYLVFDLPKLKTFMESFVPPRFQYVYIRTMSEIDVILSGFVRGQLSVCAILAVLYSIGLYFIGIDMAVAIGVLAGATFIIPYVGTIIGILFSVVMALLKFNDLLHPLLCIGWFGFVQLLEGTIISPKIVGNTVGLHPLVAILSLLLGGQLFGIIGMLIAVPVTAVAQVLLHSLAEYYRSSEFYRGE